MTLRDLSLIERKVLVGSRFAARESIPILAKRIGVRSHVAQRALKSLRDRGILTPCVVVDISKLGFVDYAVFFSISPESAKLHRKLMRFLVGSIEVPWVVELAGEYHYAFSLICRHISEVDEFLLSLGKSVGVEMIERTVVARTSWTVLSPRYLLAENSRKSSGYEIYSGPEVVKYDALDIELLRQLSRPEGPSDAECARALGEAVTTVRYRRRMLERKKVIVSYTFSVDGTLIGRFPHIFLLAVKKPSHELRRRLQAFISAEADSVCLLSCIGAWDYELIIDAASPYSVAEFRRRLFERFSIEIGALRSLTPLKTHKLEPFPSNIDGNRKAL
jgi:DNA-binding Lrp family transcriptional regulator